MKYTSMVKYHIGYLLFSTLPPSLRSQEMTFSGQSEAPWKERKMVTVVGEGNLPPRLSQRARHCS
jgi:hypothetical protein